MDKAIQIPGSNDFNVVFVGAGNIMFGSDEGPWNHSFRLEHKLGPRLKVVALIDPAIDRARAVLKKKCESFVISAYQDTRVFKTLDEFIKNMTPREKPRAVIVGSPPMFRGTTQSGRDIEMQILKHFPGVAMFIEKPIATGPHSEMEEAFKVSKYIHDSGVICSVGYMLRYLKAVQMMKHIIQENNLTVMATIARYACAYEAIAKPDWWDKSKSAGPVVEQGTHFCDLSRYFGGEVDIATVSAHSLEWDENAGHLSKLTIDESKIAPENRIPRVTAATWKYDSGAVGSFTHVVALQGTNYSCELEVFADGYSLKLVDPYVQPVLYVRKPGDDHEQTYRFRDDDPFFSEVSNLIDVIEDIEEDPEAAQILSSYEDACRTYELTWAIREASEYSRQQKLDASKAAADEQKAEHASA
jgi:predicted dehydrogenase